MLFSASQYLPFSNTLAEVNVFFPYKFNLFHLEMFCQPVDH